MKNLKQILIIITFTLTALNYSFGIVQWSSKVYSFSTQFSDKQYSANQITGTPSIMPDFGKSPCGWIPKNRGQFINEFVIVGFDSSIYVSQIAINENLNPGNISEIRLFDSDDKEYTVYKADSFPVNINHGRLEHIFIPKTKFLTKKLKLLVKSGYNETQFDAVAISDESDSINFNINLVQSSEIINKPERLSREVNSIYDELSPLISPDGKKLYFTRDSHPENTGNLKKDDIWVSELDSLSNFKEAQNIGFPINNDKNNFACSITPDGNSLLVGNIYLTDGKMKPGVSISYFDGEKWTFPDSLKINNFYSKGKYASYFLTSSGKNLFMSVERDDGYGGTDIYISFLLNNGNWSEPVNIGKNVNSASNEDTPFLAADETTLYFSSSGFPGYGNNDMFISRRLDSTWLNWSKPENLGPAINTSGWDAYYTLPASGEFAYFVSDKKDGNASDIYRIKLSKEMKPKSVMLISGRVVNAKTNEPLDALVKYETLPDGKEAGFARTNPKNGEYKIVLPAGEKYGVVAEAKDYIAIDENLDLRDISKYEEKKKNLFLVPIEEGQTVKMNNLFFDFGKYEILQDSYPELKRIIKFLNDNPSVNIQINGHTDNIGSKKNNMSLSQNRADAVANYINSNGIPKNRLITRGFGDTIPIADNNTENGRQQNRRVEFLILINK
ncbi:MAG: OmpA family protein [Ignavibacteriae bacterium]|nr:OmpA family protein [Ignavibacteriota bacterium]